MPRGSRGHRSRLGRLPSETRDVGKFEMTHACTPTIALRSVSHHVRVFDSGTPAPTPFPIWTDYQHARAHVQAIAGSVDAIVGFRLIDVAGNDTIKPVTLFGTLEQHWRTIEQYNKPVAHGGPGMCVYLVINQLSEAALSGAVPAGNDQITAIRSHFTDFDNTETSQASLDVAMKWAIPPTFIVRTSKRKLHAYWLVQPYHPNAIGVNTSSDIQRKLATLFSGDNVSDPARIMRLAGTSNNKDRAAPHLATIEKASGEVTEMIELTIALAHVSPSSTGGNHERHALGYQPLASPSPDAVSGTLAQVDPNDLGNDDWIQLYKAAKQAAWSHAEPQVVRAMLDAWCARYHDNKPAENDKLWRNTRETTIGWPWVKFKYGPAVAAAMFSGQAMPGMVALGTLPAVQATGELKHAEQPATPAAVPAVPLSGPEQAEWFKGCTYISTLDKIRTPSGRLMSEHQFNGTFGGPRYWTSPTGEQKPTDNSWKAATHGVLFQVPKVDHVRFDPLQPPGSIIVDDLKRQGVNTWIPPTVHTEPGNIDPWLNHLAVMFPDAHDRKVLLDYLAYCVRFPGVKIAWAPLVQSCEGAGKNLIKYAMQHALGASYCYEAKSDQLAETGGKFNAWMREKLMIIADEIKTDEKRKLVEILKPFITERRIEIQGKGADQVQEDNAANWIFFTNYQDAIPVTIDSRRYAVLFSALQSHRDLLAAGFDDQYFKRLYHWMDNGGKPRIAHYLQNYSIGIDQMPGRAPHTTSTAEAVEASRSPVEQLIINAVDDDQPGFRRGWISTTALGRLAKEQDVKLPGPSKIGEIIAKLGYRKIGKAGQCYFTENRATRPTLYHRDATSRLATYATDQGYEPAPVLSLIPGGRS